MTGLREVAYGKADRSGFMLWKSAISSSTAQSASTGNTLWGRFCTAPILLIITLFILGTPLKTTPLQKRA